MSGAGTEWTDVTVEVFNHCAGTCTGCLLSAAERKASLPVTTTDEFDAVAAAVAEHGERSGTAYRMVLTFGDVPSIPSSMQERYWRSCSSRGLRIGATMTMADESMERHRRSWERLIEHDGGAVFDVTVDPIRLARDDGYVRRIEEASATAPHLHLAALLSEAVMGTFSPEALASLFSDRLPGRPLSLGFAPSLGNLSRTNYGYDVSSAADYARRFHAFDSVQAAHLERELGRFECSGGYASFLRSTFHVGAGGEVFPTAWTMFGDVILDGRNGGRSLGRLTPGGVSLTDLLSGPTARRLAVENSATLDSDGHWNCRDCPHLESCDANGIGLVRRLYAGHERRVGSCHGPRDFVSAAGIEGDR